MLKLTLNLLHKVAIEVQSKRNIHPSWNYSLISPILKQSKDPKRCSSYRPISLLNPDYKMFKSILSERFRAFFHVLTVTSQVSFAIGKLKIILKEYYLY